MRVKSGDRERDKDLPDSVWPARRRQFEEMGRN